MSSPWPEPPCPSQKRKVLMLSPFAPRLDASMGGPRVIAQLIMALSCGEQLGLLYLRGQDEPSLDERVRAACDVAIEVKRADASAGIRRWREHAAAALDLARGIPSWVSGWHQPAFARTLRSLTSTWQPEIVQAEFHLMAQYLPALGPARPPTVLNQHEPGAAAASDRSRLGLMPGRVAPWLEVRAWRKYEQSLARHVDAIVTFTERDREAMEALHPSGKLKVIALGAFVPHVPANPLGGQPPAILFFGNYLHAPNLDAALHLAHDIYPQLRAQVPDLCLWLPGDGAPAALLALANEQVHVPGRVASLQPYLDGAAVVVAPIRIGGGMRVKVLEALAAGKAVVASPRALEGLNLVDGEQVLSAQSDEDFVRRVLWLIGNPAERSRLAGRARQWAVEHLSWDRTAAKYSALYDELQRDAQTADVERKSRG